MRWPSNSLQRRLHRGSLLSPDGGLHAGGDHFLRSQAVAVGGREGLILAAALDKGSQFGFVGRSKPVYELGEGAAVVAHRERSIGKRLLAAPSSVGLDGDIEELLIKMPD